MRSLHRVLIGLTAAVLLAPAVPLSAQTAAPKTMLFRVKSPSGGTVHLLGSVHLLSPDAAKLPDVVDSAFAHATTIAFETYLDSVQARATELLVRGRYVGGATLSGSLSSAGAPRVDSLLKQYGLSMPQVNQFKPWLVSVLLTQLVMQRAKFQAQLGVDAQLNARAKSAGKTIIGLESVEFQLGLFDRLPPADQESMLTTAVGPDSAAMSLAAIKDAWLTGNTRTLDSLLNRTERESPTLYSIMVIDRNRSWVPKIEQLMSSKTDALIVVGAAHLVGRDGVLEMLKAKGYSVEQM